MKRFISFSVTIAIITLLLLPLNVLASTGLSITATPADGKNYTRLDWTNLGPGYTYMVYSKSQNEEIFQSIPSKSDVKVLNIYPSPVANTGLSGGKKDLDGNTIPDSGILKTWLEKENINDVKIDCVSLTSFNANPTKYLNKVNGKWNYDCVFYGMWNLDSDIMYPNDTAIEHLRTFIHEGGGFMTSHHTIGYRGLGKGVNKLARELGVEIFGRKQADSSGGYSAKDSNGNIYPTVSFEIDDPSSNTSPDGSDYWNGSSKVQIVKKGLLTNYPFKVGDISDTYDIPFQHSLSVFGKGDIWMTSVKPTGASYNNPSIFKEITTSPSTGEKGTNNFYVHTFNNTAIINSGHSFPQITQAETRIIANTLYYLAQMTSNTTCDDHKSQDVTNPDKVNVSGVSVDTNGLTVNYSQPQDNGTSYEYYVKASNDSTGEEITSDTVSSTITSGIDGYSYVIDNSANTEPDNQIDTRALTISTPLSSLDLTKPIYIHIKAVDKVGNYSETTHYEYKYTDKLELDPTSATLKIGEAKKINTTVTSLNYTNSDVVWISNNEAVASVDQEGNVRALEEGTAIITARIKGTDITADCEVTVSGTLKVLDIEPGQSIIMKNQRVAIDLTIDNIKEIAAEDVVIKYDSSKLQFLGADETEGIKIIKNDVKTGELRFILASKGIENVVQTKKILLKLNFKGKGLGDAEVKITKGRVSDGIEMEKLLKETECGYGVITVKDNIVDVNKNGEFTLLDLAIDARHLGEDPSTLSQYNTDIVMNRAIDEDDLTEIAKYMLLNPNYN